MDKCTKYIGVPCLYGAIIAQNTKVVVVFL